MEQIERRHVDWRKTGKNLKLLRQDNMNLRRCACRANNLHKENCAGECTECKFDMDCSISRKELAVLFDVSDSVIYSWETGRTPVGIEDLLYYCAIAKVKPEAIVVFSD